jgi:CTP-dependent riboflavin kinase
VVEDAVIERLASFEPTFEESAASIVYPSPHEHIPRIRKAYWYYAATARRDGREESVLVRRAMAPLPRVVELFSAVSLRDTFDLAANDVISVEVHASRRARGREAG